MAISCIYANFHSFLVRYYTNFTLTLVFYSYRGYKILGVVAVRKGSAAVLFRVT